MSVNIEEFKKLLLDEKTKIESALSDSSHKNPLDPNDWEPTYPDFNIDTSDRNDLASEVEGFGTNIGLNTILEERLREVDAALERIEKGTYGIDAETHKPISEERLRANPAATNEVKKK